MIPLILTFLYGNVFAQYICEGDCVNGYGVKKVEGSKAYMEGRFSEGVLQEGTVAFPNGDLFTGKFSDNFLKEGSKLLHNGKKLEGKFFKNVLVEGTITEPDGASRRIRMKSLGTAN